MREVICKLDGDPEFCPLPFCGCETNLPPEDPAQLDLFDDSQPTDNYPQAPVGTGLGPRGAGESP